MFVEWLRPKFAMQELLPNDLYRKHITKIIMTSGTLISARGSAPTKQYCSMYLNANVIAKIVHREVLDIICSMRLSFFLINIPTEIHGKPLDTKFVSKYHGKESSRSG